MRLFLLSIILSIIISLSFISCYVQLNDHLNHAGHEATEHDWDQSIAIFRQHFSRLSASLPSFSNSNNGDIDIKSLLSSSSSPPITDLSSILRLKYHPSKFESLKCSSCKILTKAAMAVMGSNTTIAALEAATAKLCTKVGSGLESLCNKFFDGIIGLLPFALSELHLIGLDDPTALCSFLSYCDVFCCNDNNLPEQIHLALTGRAGEMLISWTTLADTASSTVQFGTDEESLINYVNGTSHTYTQGGWHGMIHMVVLTGLKPRTKYYYRVGDQTTNQWSSIIPFTTLPDSIDSDHPLRILVIGDMGEDANGQLGISRANALVLSGDIDLIIHNGDESYANGYQARWDNYLRLLEPAISRVPYMLVPGNHEIFFNFAAVKARFWMPGLFSDPSSPYPSSNNSLYYSFDIPCVHFLAINTESRLNTAYVDKDQLQFINDNLQRFQLNKNNQQYHECNGTPFLIAYGHRPLYCTTADNGNCIMWANYLRGLLEDIYYNNSINIVFEAHEHNYERTYPVYKNELNNNAPHYLLQGAGGNREGVDGYDRKPDWSAYQSSFWGLGILNIYNSTHIQWRYYEDQQSNNYVKQIYKQGGINKMEIPPQMPPTYPDKPQDQLWVIKKN